jgi:hypothetical protein
MVRPKNYQPESGYDISSVIGSIDTPKEKPISISPFVGGYNTYNKPSELDTNETPYCMNARIYRGKLEPRSGLSLLYAGFDSSIMLIKEFVLSSGGKYYIVVTLKSLYRSSDLSTWTRVPYPYNTGTVTVDSGTPTIVTGSGTAFLANVRVGDRFKLDADGTYGVVLSVDSDTQLTLATDYPTDGAGVAYTIDKYFGGTLNDAFWAQTIGDVDYFVFSQGIDPVSYVDSTLTSISRLSSDCPASKYGIYFADRLVIANLSSLPYRTQWCIAGNYTNWTGTGSGYKDWVEDSYEITGLSLMLGRCVVYKQYSICHMSRTGLGYNPFQFDTVVPGIGVFIPGTLVSTGLFDVFWGSDDCYKYDSRGDPVSLGTKVKDEFLKAIDPRYYLTCHSLVVEEYSEIQFYYPSSGNTYPNKALVYNYEMNIWEGIWDMLATASGYGEQFAGITWDSLVGKGYTWDTYPGRWDDSNLTATQSINLVGNGTSLYKQDSSKINDEGTNFIFEARTKVFKSPEKKEISAYRIVIDYYASVTTTLLASLSENGGKSFGSEVSVVLDISEPDMPKRAFFDFLTTIETAMLRLRVLTGGRFSLVNIDAEAMASGDIIA